MLLYKIVRSVVLLVSEVGVTTIVGNVIKANTPLTLNFKKKVLTAVGTFVINGMASRAVNKYVSKEMDEMFLPKDITNNDPSI